MHRPTPTTVLVVQPDPSCPLDRFDRWLTEEGLRLRVVRPYAGEPLPALVEEDALVVLGGDMSALDDPTYPWLEGVRRLLRAASELGRPALGICLGGQLTAQAFGGTVAEGSNGPEVGVVTVRWLPEARDDPLVGGLPEPFLSGGMHGDEITALPEDAVLLGSSRQYAVQVFRVGRSTWGVQFHPELSPALYGAWLRALDPQDEAFRRADEGLSDVIRLDPEVASHTRELARRFAALVRTR